MRVAVIGCGKIGLRRIESLDKDDELIFCVDTNIANAKKLADQYGAVALQDYHEACKNDMIDAVVVSTTNDMLFPISMDAIIHGKHVLVEKPVGKHSGEIDQLIKAQLVSQSTVLTGYNHRKHPSMIQSMMKILHLGEIYYIDAIYGHGGSHEEKPSWRTDVNKSGFGELGEKGCHLIDLSRWFFNMEDHELFSKVSGKVSTFYRNGLDDNAFITLENSKGQVAHLHSSCTTWKNTFQFSITGQYGNMVINGFGGSYGTETWTMNMLQEGKIKPTVKTIEFLEEDNSWSLEWQEFKRCIGGHMRPSSNLWSALSVMDTVEAIYDTCS